MGVALVVVPGIAAAWLWFAPAGRGRAARAAPAARGRRRRWCSWAARGRRSCELTPAADRPWVSGTSDNSILSLIFEYNGLGRVDGQTGGPGGGGRQHVRRRAGPLRLLNSALGGQAGWLLGFALVGGLAVLLAQPPAPRRCAQRLADRGRRRVRHDRRAVQLRRAASSTPTTSRCWRRSRPRSSAPARRSCSRAAAGARMLAPAGGGGRRGRSSWSCAATTRGSSTGCAPVLIVVGAARRCSR